MSPVISEAVPEHQMVGQIVAGGRPPVLVLRLADEPHRRGSIDAIHHAGSMVALEEQPRLIDD